MGPAGVGRSDRTYLQQLSTNTGCSLENLPNGDGESCLRLNMMMKMGIFDG